MSIKSFGLKSIVFISPLIFLFILSSLLYSSEQGDLIRVGYIAQDEEYRKSFDIEFNRPIYYKNLTSKTVTEKSKISILVVGDSFSEQGSYGYKNYLAEIDSFEVVYYLNSSQDNPIQVLTNIINGDLTDKIRFDYVILQSVERHFIQRSRGLVLDQELNLSDFDLNKKSKTAMSHITGAEFPPKEIIKFPLYNLLYQLKDNAYLSQTYRVSISKPLFSGSRENELLFLEDDLKLIRINNDKSGVTKLNDALNDLSKKLKIKGIKLIVLPSPDKFGLYYDYIVSKEDYPKPLFFQNFSKMNKDYLCIDSKELLSAAINRKQDIYFYDDTHWSPWAAQLIADELKRVIIDSRF